MFLRKSWVGWIQSGRCVDSGTTRKERERKRVVDGPRMPMHLFWATVRRLCPTSPDSVHRAPVARLAKVTLTLQLKESGVSY